MVTSGDTAEGRQVLVRLAERALARLEPLRFDLARSDAQRDAVLRLRHACVVAEGWTLPEGPEHDPDDARATFITCHDGDALVGSMRIVTPSPDRPLPTERAFDVRARPAGAVVDVGRLVVAPRARSGRSHRIIGGLCARGWLEISDYGWDRAISSATPELIELYLALGLRVAVLGAARPYWGARRAPICIEGAEDSFAFLTRAAPPAPSRSAAP